MLPFIKATRTLKAYLFGNGNFQEPNYNNGILEGINTDLQQAKKKV